jgi:hypothetical protein
MTPALFALRGWLWLCFCAATIGVAPAAEPVPDVAIDFSTVGFREGETPPEVPAVLRVAPVAGDNTDRLQQAIERVGAMPIGAQGFRGAIELEPGTFEIEGQLRLKHSGVVLRGSAKGDTVLLATGQGRRSLIEIGTSDEGQWATGVRVSEDVPVGGRRLKLATSHGFKPGDHIAVRRPSVAEWIQSLGMHHAEGPFADLRLIWRPGSRDLVWYRTIAQIDPTGTELHLDAPICAALEQRFGGGTVQRLASTTPPENIGVERLVLRSAHDPNFQHDEEHAWIAIQVNRVADAWVRDVECVGFVSSAVRVGSLARRVTITRCESREPVSENAGYRRQSFIVEGQQVLVTDCRSEDARNDFVTGHCAAGPNVFLNCTASGSQGPSGGFESWSVGTLFERVQIGGGEIYLGRDTVRSQAAGWVAGNSVVWNCEASAIAIESPSGARNLEVTATAPLYETQRSARQSAPSLPPALDRSFFPAPIQFQYDPSPANVVVNSRPVQIVNGRFSSAGELLWGGQLSEPWWLGQTSPAVASEVGVSITRFVPGKTGFGLTENLPALADYMVEANMPFFQTGPALWYDRRRDDHSIVRRDTADVWAPFYEMPWRRTGRGSAWDGMSQYDISKYNPWYFSRMREFLAECEKRGLLMYHFLYNTHNLLETQAHWVDYPWRPANSENDAGLPEPPPIDPRNTVHLAKYFYDAGHPGRRSLHRDYIRHVLDQLGFSENVIFSLGFQFAGPLEFQRFFLEVVQEWERDRGRRVRVALVTSKDITDAILEDPRFVGSIDVIDTRYWQYRPDGQLWAPPGNRNLAFREMIGEKFGRATDAPPPTSEEWAYWQVREYRDRFPKKAVTTWHNGVGPVPGLMAGAAQVLLRNPTAGHSHGLKPESHPIDGFIRRYVGIGLLKLTPSSSPRPEPGDVWTLTSEDRRSILLYSAIGAYVPVETVAPHSRYRVVWCNAQDGRVVAETDSFDPALLQSLKKPDESAWLAWLVAES